MLCFGSACDSAKKVTETVAEPAWKSRLRQSQTVMQQAFIESGKTEEEVADDIDAEKHDHGHRKNDEDGLGTASEEEGQHQLVFRSRSGLAKTAAQGVARLPDGTHWRFVEVASVYSSERAS